MSNQRSGFPEPSSPERAKEIELALARLAVDFGSSRPAYVSGPMTTGPRFFRWVTTDGAKLEHKSQDYIHQHQEFVVEENNRDILAATGRLREQLSRQVIEPASFDAPGWKQTDYHFFWGEVIRRIVSDVYFLDGWSSSAGCTYEFLIAQIENKPCFDASGKILSRNEGLRLVSRDLERLRGLGKAGERLAWAADQLSDLTND